MSALVSLTILPWKPCSQSLFTDIAMEVARRQQELQNEKTKPLTMAFSELRAKKPQAAGDAEGRVWGWEGGGEARSLKCTALFMTFGELRAPAREVWLKGYVTPTFAISKISFLFVALRKNVANAEKAAASGSTWKNSEKSY